MKGRKIALALLAMFVVSAIVPSISFAQDDEVPYGPWVDAISFQSESDQAKVFDMLENNEVQMHVSDINDPDIFADIRASPNLDYAMSFGLFFDLTFNPVGPTFPVTGKFNPFYNPKMREAMNYIVDRNFIAEELLGGLAKPKFLHIPSAFPDYGRLADKFKLLEAQYSPDFEKAKGIIFHEMAEMGAVLEEGLWHYNDEPVTLKILIRIDSPPRTRIGDHVANMLEELGFVTERMYRTSAEASPIWIWGNPEDGEFHIYTGGWISTIVDRDEAGDFAFQYTPRGGWGSPLWQAYTPDPLFQEVAYRLDDADWATYEERQDLMAKAAEMALQDSVKVWLVDQTTPFPYRKEIAVAGDLASGLFANKISSRTIRYKDQVGGLVKASDREVLVDPWNPIVGTNWAYDAHIILPTVDEEIIYNPYTGLPMPNVFESATMELLKDKEGKVVNSSPWLELTFVDEIEVPADAWFDWDTDNKQVVFAPPGTTARAKVVLNYGDVIGNVKYHDGSVMTLADWLAVWPLDFERADPASPFYDEASLPEFGNFKSIFRGMRITSETPLVLEIYVDFSSLDAEYILAEAVEQTHVQQPTDGLDCFYPSIPWHVQVIGLMAEEKGLLAYTADKADANEIEWMNYIGGPSVAVLESMLAEAEDTGYIPFADLLSDYIDADEVSARYANLRSWYQERGHFWVAIGPYYLDSVDFTGHSALISAFRDYRFKADRWDWLSAPPIPESAVDAPDNVVPGLEATFDLALSIAGQPYSNERIDFVKYLVLDSAGNVVTSGEAVAEAEGQWAVTLSDTETAKITPGTYTLATIALSKDVAIPGTLETPFAVIPALSYLQALLAQKEAQLTAEIAQLETTLTEDISTLQGELQALGAVGALQTITYASIGVAIVAIVIAIYAAVAKK